MQVKTLALGTVFLTGITLFSLNKMPDPVVQKSIQRRAAATPAAKMPKLARRPQKRNISPASETRLKRRSVLAKRKSPSRHKPYFVVNTQKKNYLD